MGELQAYTKNDSVGVFSNPDMFEHGQRMAKALCSSELVPKAYQNNIPNAMIAIDIGMRMNLSPMIVMQNLHIIHGSPSWKSSFLVAGVNSSGKCSKIQYKEEDLGTIEHKGKTIQNKRYTAWAKDVEGNILKGPSVDIKTAIDEGWYDKTDKRGNFVSKWRTMPELMTMYRAGAFFVRIHFPEVGLGIPTKEEVMDVPEMVDAGYAETVNTQSVMQDLNAKIAPSQNETETQTVEPETEDVQAETEDDESWG